jgi:hypothetical protein
MKLAEAISNANSSGQGPDPDHAKNPFHELLLDQKFKYSHSTPVKVGGKEEIHHTYKNGDRNVSARKSSQRNLWIWASSTGGSGTQITGSDEAKLKKHIKGLRSKKKLAEHLISIHEKEDLGKKLLKLFNGAVDKSLWKNIKLDTSNGENFPEVTADAKGNDVNFQAELNVDASKQFGLVIDFRVFDTLTSKTLKDKSRRIEVGQKMNLFKKEIKGVEDVVRKLFK